MTINNSEVVGKTEDYVIRKKDDEYYISNFTSKGVGKTVLTIPSHVEVDEEEYQISYVSDIFKENNSVRKITIEIPSDKIDLGGCKSLRVVEISQDNISNANVFLSGFNKLDVYITNSNFEYSDEYLFVNNNQIYYGEIPEYNYFDNMFTSDIINVVLVVISIIVGVIGIIFMIKILIDELLDKELFILGIISVVLMAVYVIGTIILNIMGISSLIYFQGMLYILALSFGFAFIIAEEELCYERLYRILVLVSCALVVVSLIWYVPKAIMISTIVSLVIICSGYVGIRKLLLDENLPVLSIILAIIVSLLTVPSVYLVDALITSSLTDSKSGIFAGLGVVIVVIIIAGIIKMINDGVFTGNYEPQPSRPVSIFKTEPKFNGLFFSNISLPSDCMWESNPYVSIKDNHIKISGSIKVTRELSYESELSEYKYSCQRYINNSCNKILEDFYEKYPDSERYSLEFEISIRGEY